VRRLFSQIAVKKRGYSGAEVARFPGVTASAGNRPAASEELPDLAVYKCEDFNICVTFCYYLMKPILTARPRRYLRGLELAILQ